MTANAVKEDVHGSVHILSPLMSFGRNRVPCGACCCGEGLVEIGDDVVDVFNADAEPYRFGKNAGLALVFRRHLTMRGGRRMAGERLRIADVHEGVTRFNAS